MAFENVKERKPGPLPAEVRRERLAALVATRGFAAVADASAVLGVSEVTVRADLARLEDEGRVLRVRGGAVAPPRERPVESTAGEAADRKRAIGREAAAMVRGGSSILLDVGSTTLAVAHALVERGELVDVVVVTNGLGIALALEPAIPRFTVVVTGGTLRPLQHSLVDPVAVRTLGELHVDLAILGCTGVDEHGRVTNVNLPEAEVKRAMIAAARERVLVADGSKLGVRHLGLIGTLADFGTLVTAGPGAERIADAARAAGTRIVEATVG